MDIIYTQSITVFDRNGDGYVVASEIQYVMHHLGHDLTFADVERIMKRGDSNADGRLDYNGKYWHMVLVHGCFRRGCIK